MNLVVEIRTRGVTLAQWREAYHSDAFNQLVAERMKLRERSVVARETLPDGRERLATRTVPDIDLPKTVLKLIEGHEIAYTEVTTIDLETLVGDLVVQSEAGKAVQVGGALRFDVDDGGVLMQFDGTIKVKVFGLGTVIERLIAREVRKRYAAIEPLLQQFVDERRGE